MRQISACVAAMVLVWVLLPPPNAGPDEPGHLIRSAGLVRGDFDGSPSDLGPTINVFDVPGWVGTPSPECYWFSPGTPASCSTELPPTPESAFVFAASSSYPVWGYVLPGIGTLAGTARLSTYLSRVLDALIPAVLVVGALWVARRHGTATALGVAVAVTPLAWFVFGVVNPSGLAIAGGLAVWTVVATRAPPRTGEFFAVDWVPRWLMAAGWASLVLPRRDGLLWLGVVVSLVVLVRGDSLRGWWNWLGPWSRVVVAASSFAAASWAALAGNDTRPSLVGLLLPFAAMAVRWVWTSWARPSRGRMNFVVVVALLAVPVAIYTTSSVRQGEFNYREWRAVFGSTGGNFSEAIGLLGWADTPIPDSAEMLLLVTVGALAGAAMFAGRSRSVGLAASVVVAAVISAWVIELAHGGITGNYWQGRYYLPLLTGVPVVLGAGVSESLSGDRDADTLMKGLSVLWLLVVNLSVFEAARRWGVGIEGTLIPTSWDTYDTPLPVIVLLGLHVAATVGLVAWLFAGASAAGEAADAADGAAGAPAKA